MEMQISIPDLEDDQIYPLENATHGNVNVLESICFQYPSNMSQSVGTTVDSNKPKPFRGAAMEHSRSGSAISFESSTGSRSGGVVTGYGTSGGVTAPASTSNFNQSTTGFPRKGSFASLKAVFKGNSSTAMQDAYPQQLRNPFNATGSSSSAGLPSSSTKSTIASPAAHGRNDSYVSSIASRPRVGQSSSQRHVQQSSLYSENSMGGISTSHSESTNGSAFRSGPSMPPMPPFPDAYLTGGQQQITNSLPPARTAYARSMSVPDRNVQAILSDLESMPPPPMPNQMTNQAHDRTNSFQSSLEQNEASQWINSGQGEGYGSYEEPLQPPQRIFANSLHQRGSSRGSREASEDGARASFEHQQAMNRGPSRLAGAQGMPPMRVDRGGKHRNGLMTGENSSVASLPNGIGLDDPVSPAEYAINVLCSRFLTLAGVRIRTAIGGVDESDPSLERNLGVGADTLLDTLLDSLAHVSKKNPAAVIKSMFQWRDNMMDDRIDVGEVRGALAGSQMGLAMGVRDVANVLMRRKVLATAYLLSRSLIQIASNLSPGPGENTIKGLSDAQVGELQGRSFELMRECSRERIPASRMQADAFDLASRLLGVLSKVSFAAVGDRFVAFLEQASRANPNPKEGDIASEVAVAAIRHLQITPFPMEIFEEGAEFLEVMARNFSAAHGQRLKSTYAESLSALLMPVAKLASAELHHPTWVKALDSIAPRAFAMIAKPRYWSVAYSLYVAVLCVSPEDRFQQPAQLWSWVQCLDAGVARMSKDRGVRNIVMNASIALLWTYLFRCRESSSTTTKRLETFTRIWFPSNRITLYPNDLTNLECHIYITHYILYRQFDVGRDMVLDFLRAQTLSGNHLSVSPEALSKQRMTVAVRAILLTLDAYVKETSPPFPSESKYEVERSDLGDELSETFTYPTPDIANSQAQFNDLIGKIALLCNHQVGGVSIFSDAVTLTRGTSFNTVVAATKGVSDEERLIWRPHGSARFTAAYNRDHQPYIELLRACIDAWPRCLTANIPFPNVLSVLHRAYFSADPSLADAAARCLKRIAEQRKGGATAVVTSFMRYLLRVDMVYWETHANQMLILSKIEFAVKLLSSFLQIWLNDLKKKQAVDAGKKGWEMERTSAWAIIDEVEAVGLSLLCSAWRPLRRHAIGILRIVATLDDLFAGSANKRNLLLNEQIDDFDKEDEPTRVIHLLNMPSSRFINTTNDPNSEEATDITAWEKSRTKKWKRAPTSKETLAELAESDKTSESTNWLLVVPKFLRMCLEHFPTTIAVFRSIVTSRIIGMESAVSAAAGTSNRPPAGGVSTLRGQAVGAAGALMPFTTLGNNTTLAANTGLTNEQGLMAEHWKMYILALCTTTTSIEGSAHRIKVKEGEIPSERVIAAKDLFQKLVPFLASDHARFRDAVVSALGNINANLYKTLLETLQTVNAQLSEDFRRSSSKRNREHERLRTALAHVIQLTSAHMTSHGTLDDPSIVHLILQWIKETFNFLTDKEIRLDWEFHRLRRFFAGVVEEFFDALYTSESKRSNKENAEKFLNIDTRLRMFKLLRDWHSFSQAAKDGPSKLANLLANVAEKYREDRNRENMLTLLRIETQMLSFHASSAMAALCQGVISVADAQSTGPAISPMSIEPSSLIEWLKHLFLSPSPQNHAVACRALKALLIHNAPNKHLIRLTLEHAVAEPERTSATRSFFAVFADVIVEKKANDRMPLELPQILCLGLVKLGHPDIDTRKKAFVLLNSVTPLEQGTSVIAAMEGGVSSPLPATYLRAQRDISTLLAEKFQDHKVAMLSEYALRLPEIDLSRRATTLGLLPEWLHRIQFTGETNLMGTGVALSRRAMLVLSNLLAMTIRYGDEHNFEIQDMWASLAEGDDYATNATTIVKFLIQQALSLRSSSFIMHAKRAVSCLSHTVLAPALFTEMCSYIEPSSMIPVPLEHNRLTTSDPQLDHLYMANIEAHLPPPSRRQTFSPGQVSLLFVGELTYEKSQLLIEKLPLLLHAIFMQVDSTSAFTQEQVMSMFEQLMRSLTNEFVGSSQDLALQMEKLFDKGTSIFWTQDEADFDAFQTPKVMRATVLDTLSIVKYHIDNINERWGNVALEWATSNPVRHMACRSFQMFRILMPEVNYSMLADMLGRLSNTISDSTRIDNQSFALEILYTMKAIVRNINVEDHHPLTGSKRALLGHIFWMNVACLSTVNESEFGQAVGLLHLLLEKLNLESGETVSFLQAQCPDGWEGEIGGLQNLVMRGLRSSSLYTESFKLLARMAKIADEHLIDRQDSRVGTLFIVSLPWFLQASDEPGSIDETIILSLAENIASLATKRGKSDIERVSTSVAKKRFRTTDDLLRQAISSCVRAGFLPNHATGMALTLLALTFNAEPWLRKRTLQVLKIFFQSVDTRKQELHDLGPELLMPLLRLLSTDLSLEALEVLEEKILASVPSAGAVYQGQRRGPNAQQIVRMSLQWHKNPNVFNQSQRNVGKSSRQGGNFAMNGPSGNSSTHGTNWHTHSSEQESSHNAQETNSLFGLPEDTGWSVADVPDWTSRTRINTLSVFKSVELLLDTPPVGEVNFVDDYDAEGDNVFEQNMTASRTGMEEMDSASMAGAGMKSTTAQSFASQNGNILPAEQDSFASQSSSAVAAAQVSKGNNLLLDDEKNNIGDIVSQLHDLSSFFIDDDLGNYSVDIDDTSDKAGKRRTRKWNNTSIGGGGGGSNSSGSTRLTNFWGGGGNNAGASLSSIGGKSDGIIEESSGEQIAKILSRSALANIMGRGRESGASIGSGNRSMNDSSRERRPSQESSRFGESTMIAESSSGELGGSEVGGEAEANTSTGSKRHSMWARKALFGTKRNQQTPLRSASETIPLPSLDNANFIAFNGQTSLSSSPPHIPASNSAPLMTLDNNVGDETAK